MKKGSQSGGGHQKLTSKETHVLCLLTEDFLTIKKIALMTRKSTRSVQKIAKRLKEKGVLIGDSHKGFAKTNIGGIFPQKRFALDPQKSDTSIQKSTKKIRLHGQAFRIGLLYTNPNEYVGYKKIKEDGNNIYYDGNTITLHKDSIRIYSSEERSFWGKDVDEATSKSIQYWNLFFQKLENRLKIKILKDQKANIKIFRQHYAEVDNELAEEYNDKKIKVKVFANDDGKLAYLIDFSHKLNEFEAVHSKTSPEDMEKIAKVFNDYRDNPGIPTPSETFMMIGEIVKIQKFEVEKMGLYAENIKSHIGAIQELGSGVRSFVSEIQELKKIIKELKK